MLDVVIRDAQVIDGTGKPAVRSEIGILNGRIVADAGRESARQVIEGDGLVVAPGFVDLHTHYDVQFMWDGAASPSTLHGTTTVMGGNCGFTIAPLRKDTTDYLMRMMAVVEGMPLVSLQSGTDWAWRSFEEWLARLEHRLSINAGFLVGHNALRLAVMGHAAVGAKASGNEIAQMVQLLDTCLRAGGLGFSTTQKAVHVDHNGVPVPSYHASTEELLALAAVLQRHPGTSLEFASDGLGKLRHAPEDVELMTAMSRQAGRPINWNTVRIKPDDLGFADAQLQASDYARTHGGRIVGLTNPKPYRLRLSFASGMPLNGLPGWASTFGLDIEERKRAFADPDLRRLLRLAESSVLRESHQPLVRWGEYEVAEGYGPTAKALEGRTIASLAAGVARDPFDVLLDLVIADDLRTTFLAPEGDNSESAWRERARIWLDPRTVVGGADAGAHLDLICGANYTTTLLGEGVRERKLMSLEEAVRQLSDIPARLYGLTERGRIAEGWHADLVVFDPVTVGPGVERARSDLPGSGGRLYSEATGIQYVFVNGSAVVRDGKLTGNTSGRVLRSGQDTAAVNVSH